MSHVDQFESFFRAATKERYHPTDVKLASVLVVTDLSAVQAQELTLRTQALLPDALRHARWTTLDASATRSVAEVLAATQSQLPDLVCTYRNLHSDTWRWPYSLGEHLDVLTQVSQAPVLVLPHPGEASDWGLEHGTREVMAITDHLTGDDRLVSWAAAMTRPDGTLFLTHVEDQASVNRMVDVIGKLPALDTDVAREEIPRQLLKEPSDYIESARQALKQHHPHLRVEARVSLGSRLAEVKRLIGEHGVDLLVLNTKDNEQLAMHGLAYPLAVELRAVPMLML